jgi:hypothetical protein
MNAGSDRAVETRRPTLVDQIDGLEQRIADGRDEPHLTERLADTRAELSRLQGSHWGSQVAPERSQSVV